MGRHLGFSQPPHQPPITIVPHRPTSFPCYSLSQLSTVRYTNTDYTLRSPAELLSNMASNPKFFKDMKKTDLVGLANETKLPVPEYAPDHSCSQRDNSVAIERETNMLTCRRA
jgi:hypothetical protein